MRTFSAVPLIVSLGLLAGCGGGGGGGGDSGVPYTGLTTEAKVTPANAEDFASLAMGGGDLESVGGFASRQVQNEGNPGLSDPLATASRLRNLVLQKLQTQRAYRTAAADLDPVPGPCGGSMAISIQVNDETGVFSGSINFENYCDDGVVNGRTKFSGQIDLYSLEPVEMTLSFSVLTFEDAEDRFAMGGSMSFDFGYPTTTFHMTVSVRDDVEGMTVRFEDYVVSTEVVADGFTSITTGRCYHPDYGYVVLSTPTPFHIGWSAPYPSSGAIRGNGADGTWVLLTALSATQCQVQAYTNGALDWDSGPLPWDEL